MKKINIVIEKINEDGDSYFLATCKELPGFLAEGDTFEEITKNSIDVAKEFIFELEENKKKNISKAEIEKILTYYNFSHSFTGLTIA